MLAILPKHHEKANKDVISLRAITRSPYILLEESHYSEPLEAFQANQLIPDIKFTLHDDYAIMTMVEAGLGVSILAELSLRRTNYNIVALPTQPPITRTIAVAYKDKGSLPIASKYFIEFLLSKASELP